MAAWTAVLCAPSKAENNRVAACVTIQGSTLWLVGSCALQLGPQTTHALLHPDPPLTRVVIWL